MSKQKTLYCLIVVLILMMAVGGSLSAYVASERFSGISFTEEAEGHGGLYLERTHILATDIPTIQVEGTTATITGGGKYELSGVLEDGQIIVDAGDEDEVILELEDASIHCSDSAPIWIKNAGKVKIKLPEDTVNTLSDGEFYCFSQEDEGKPNACIWSSCDLTIKGKGSLTVTANFQNGISTSDDLEIKSSLLTVTAPKYALRGRDGIQMTGGMVSVNAGDTALYTLGSISVENGVLSISAGQTALHAVTGISLSPQADIAAKAPTLTGCNGTVTGTEYIKPLE